MSSSNILLCLSAAGLAKYANNFAQLTDQQFLSLLMSEYGSYGIVDMEDKQKLFRLLKNLNGEAKDRRQAAQAKPNAGLDLGDGGLLDLDAHDGDLLAHACGPALQLSPMGNDRVKPTHQPAASQQPYAPQPVPQMAQAAQQVSSLEEVDPPKIRVVVRKRPLNKKERERGEEDVVDANMSRSFVTVSETKSKVDLTKYQEKHQFNFDEALDESVSNEAVYQFTVQPLVHTLFKNGKASCFAYGQTGSGKTYTMSPLPIRATADIVRYLARPEYRDVNLYVSCFEIYGNKVFDLLNVRKRLNILEDGKKQVVVVGLKECLVEEVAVVKQLIEEANRQRSVGSTAANADSSRSHSIMQFALKRGSGDGDGKLVGKISFIDLAGSERGADTFDNNRQTRLEGAEINKSLLALKECIRALDSDARHVPFRGSKLTAVLRDSFLGDQARTVMIANISPSNLSVEHTLNTLRYADRVKELRKDKVDRTPGGVTPGQDPAYYAAVMQAHHDAPAAAAPVARDRSPLKDIKSNRPRTPSRMEHYVAKPEVVVQMPARQIDDDDLEDDELLRQREDLMDTILEEEEQLITAHRLQIEETMDVVRREMALLTDVDQPGSAIDQYVDKLDVILRGKLEKIQELLAKLERFKEHLKQEEIMSRSIPPSGGKRR
ncbi:P-loop containing nucleoside triphosphate hydrolase protein [Haematococcus lacustris]